MIYRLIFIVGFLIVPGLAFSAIEVSSEPQPPVSNQDVAFYNRTIARLKDRKDPVWSEVTADITPYRGSNWNETAAGKTIRPGQRFEILEHKTGWNGSTYSLVRVPDSEELYWVPTRQISKDHDTMTVGRYSRTQIAPSTGSRLESFSHPVELRKAAETPIAARIEPKQAATFSPVAGIVVVNADPATTPKLDEAPRAIPGLTVGPDFYGIQPSAVTSQVGTQPLKAGDPTKICHTGTTAEGSVGFHCHDGVVPIMSVDPALERVRLAAEEAKVKVAAATPGAAVPKVAADAKPVEKCQNWKSPIHTSHRLTDCLGASRGPNRRHAGVDLGNGQKPNTEIYAAGPGKIIQTGWMGGYGCVIQVQHDTCPDSIKAYSSLASKKCISFYAHLEQTKGGKCPGSAGAKVNSCTKIAFMGGTGGNYPKHLHFEVRIKENDKLRLNPMVAFGKELKAGASNPGGCKGTESWLAATPGGSATAYTNGETAQQRYASQRRSKGRAN